MHILGVYLQMHAHRTLPLLSIVDVQLCSQLPTYAGLWRAEIYMMFWTCPKITKPNPHKKNSKYVHFLTKIQNRSGPKEELKMQHQCIIVKLQAAHIIYICWNMNSRVSDPSLFYFLKTSLCICTCPEKVLFSPLRLSSKR